MSAPCLLRDRSEVVIRPIEPGDREQLAAGFARLSPESRYLRFLAPMARLTDDMLDYLTEVDHHDHEALVAVDPATGKGTGVARFVRLADRPDTAEAAVTVADDWQGRGLGTLLLELLSGRARQEGITRFTALMLAENTEMMELLERLGPVRVIDREVGTVEVELPLPGEGLGPELRSLLRLVARDAGGTKSPDALERPRDAADREELSDGLGAQR